MTIGQRIKIRRMELGMSQEELAHKLGLKSKTSVSHFERDRNNPTASVIQAYADALLTTPSKLMGIDDNDYLEQNTDLIADIVKDRDLIRMITLYKALSVKNQTQILEQIEYYSYKEKGK